MIPHYRTIENFRQKPKKSEIVCTCGWKEEFLFTEEDEVMQVKNEKPVCPDCDTSALMIHGRYSHILILDRTETSGEVIVFNEWRKKSKRKKILHLAYDLKTHYLAIEQEGEMKEITSKVEAKKAFLTEIDQEGFPMSDMDQALGTKKQEAFLDRMFIYSDKSFERFYDYVRSMPLQLLANAGFEKWNVFIFDRSIVRSKETKPHLILGLSKPILPIFKNWEISKALFKSLQQLSRKFDGQDLQAGFELATEEGWTPEAGTFRHLIKIAEEENIPSFQKFVRYVFVEAKHRQGIVEFSEVLRLLNDSITMAKEMNVDYELMPKSLKVMHDVLAMNYEVVRSEKENQAFKEAIEADNYQKLTFENEQFKIIAPIDGEDLVREGRVLSHCVASYFKRISGKRSKVYFLRQQENLDQPFVTVEVQGKQITQLSGRSNRSVNKETRKFVQEWAKTYGLALYA